MWTLPESWYDKELTASCFIRTISTVTDPIAAPATGDTTSIQTSEFTFWTQLWRTTPFVGVIATIIIAITAPVAWDASPRGAGKVLTGTSVIIWISQTKKKKLWTPLDLKRHIEQTYWNLPTCPKKYMPEEGRGGGGETLCKKASSLSLIFPWVWNDIWWNFACFLTLVG